MRVRAHTPAVAPSGRALLDTETVIERYTRPEIGALWTDEARMEGWRRVEVAACEAMDGPTEAELDAIRAATFTVAAVQEREAITDHDENVALWHERDISHSGAERVILPDSTILLDYMQHLAIRIARGMVVHEDRMLSNLDLTCGALFSQRVLLALVDSGLQRDDAYRIVVDRLNVLQAQG